MQVQSRCFAHKTNCFVTSSLSTSSCLLKRPYLSGNGSCADVQKAMPSASWSAICVFLTIQIPPSHVACLKTIFFREVLVPRMISFLILKTITKYQNGKIDSDHKNKFLTPPLVWTMLCLRRAVTWISICLSLCSVRTWSDKADNSENCQDSEDPQAEGHPASLAKQNHSPGLDSSLYCSIVPLKRLAGEIQRDANLLKKSTRWLVFTGPVVQNVDDAFHWINSLLQALRQ